MTKIWPLKLGLLFLACVIVWLTVCAFLSLKQERDFVESYKGIELENLMGSLCEDRRVEIVNLKVPRKSWLGSEEEHLPKNCRRPNRAYWPSGGDTEVLVVLDDDVPFPGYTIHIKFTYENHKGRESQTGIEIFRIFLTI